MKKLKIAMTAVFAVLFSCLFLMGCPPDDNNTDTVDTVYAQGKVIILQAYGSSDTAAGASHSFVELYNITDEAIKLDGISLYYADGTTVASGQTNDAVEDGAWKRISLDGKTIPAKGSFLILGPKQSQTAARYQIPDNYGDINDNDFTLSNRAFKVALIQSTAQLTVQNPFTGGNNGNPIAGYIDMVGAANNYQGRDLIYGFEEAPARNSASEAVRRANLIDTDDNSVDFIAARYASDGMSDEELEVRKPRNSSAGGWNPFVEPAEPKDEYDGLPPTTVGTESAHAGELLILQIGASADDDNYISHSFVELYNAGTETIDLDGFTLQYAAGTKVVGAADRDGKWEKIALEGTIEAGHSFLILGARRSTNQNPALNITADYGDMNIPTFKLDNRAVKVALMEGADLLTVQNPFNMDGNGGKAAGYVDMIGVINDDSDQILGWEGSADDKPAAGTFHITKQVGVRRTSLTDSDVNKNDFATVTYNSISSAKKEIMRPKNHDHGNWDPLAEPAVGAGSPKLMILQANIRGNNNGISNGAPTGGGFARSLVELYNNTDDEIDLSSYSLHIGQVDNWAVRVPLSGTIPAKSSFLIVSNAAESAYSVNATPRASLPAADLEADFIIGLNAAGTDVGNNWKIALMVNLPSDAVLPANPFTDTSLTTNYVDMLGVGNNTITGFEGTRASGSAPQGPRRISLDDTNNNDTDFKQADYRGRTGSNGVDDNQLYKIWPRNSTAGEWNPITGSPEVQPTVVPVQP